MDHLPSATIIGIGATALMDLWGALRRPLLGFPRLDYALIGRWVGHLARGRFRHDAIAAAAPVPGERLLGWTVHYLIGISFAALLLGIRGLDWVRHPTIGPALLVGLGTVAGPFLVMQPGMGAGIAASRTPRPGRARLQTLISHTIYGLGLYATARALHLLTGA